MLKTAGERLPMPDAEVYLFNRAFSSAESSFFLEELIETVAWKQDHLNMFGRRIPFPRLTAWYGDAAYRYSGIRNEPLLWLPALNAIRERVTLLTGHSFNSVLLNYYRHGADSMGWHADDEKELGARPVIASVSFGASRRFQFRHRYQTLLPLTEIKLENGSLLLMQGQTQQNWQHRVPKTTAATGPRVNLTFRQVELPHSLKR